MTLQSFDDPNSDEARQFLLDRRGERNHPKRHRTIGPQRRLRASKRAAAKQRAEIKKVERAKFLAAARLYWLGLADGHPSP